MGDVAADIEEFRGYARVAAAKGDLDALKSAVDTIRELGGTPEAVLPTKAMASGRGPVAPTKAEPSSWPEDVTRAGVSGFVDAATLGIGSPQNFLDMAEKGYMGARQALKRGEPDAEKRLQTAEGEQENARHNAYSVSRWPGADIIGSLLNSVRGVGGKATQAAQAVLPEAKSMGGKVLRAAVAGGVGAGTENAARTVVDGGGPGEAAQSFAEGFGPAGLAAGVGAHINLRLRDPLTLTGEYIKGMDYGRESGLFKSKEYKGPGYWDDPAKAPKGVPQGYRGVGAMARQESKGLVKHVDEVRNQLNADWETGVEHPARHRPTDLSGVRADLQDAVKHYSGGEVVDTAAEAAATQAEKNLSREVVVGAGPTLTTQIKPIATLDDLITQKQEWKAAAEMGSRATKENRPFRKMYKAAVKATARLADNHPDPEIRAAAAQQLAADRAFLKGSKVLESVNARVFGQEKSVLKGGVKAERRGANELLQIAKDTQASGIRLEDFDQLRALGGKYEEIANKMLAKVSDEATKFTFTPGTSGHAGTVGMAPLMQLEQWGKVRALEPATRRLSQPAGRMLVPPLRRDVLDAILARQQGSEMEQQNEGRQRVKQKR